MNKIGILLGSVLSLAACAIVDPAKIGMNDVQAMITDGRSGDTLELSRADLNVQMSQRLNEISLDILGKPFGLDVLEVLIENDDSWIPSINESSRHARNYGHTTVATGPSSGRHCPHTDGICHGDFQYSGACSMIGIGWILLSVDIIERGTESDGGFTYEYAVEEKTFVCSNYLNWNNCCNRVITKISTWHGSAY